MDSTVDQCTASPAYSRHPWLAKLQPEQIQQDILTGDSEPMYWAHRLTQLTSREWLEALLDPELKALYIGGAVTLPADGSVPKDLPDDLADAVHQHAYFQTQNELWRHPRLEDHVFVREYGGQGVAIREHGDNLIIQTVPKLRTSYPDVWEHIWDAENGKWKRALAVNVWLQSNKTEKYARAVWKPGLYPGADEDARLVPSREEFNLWRGWKLPSPTKEEDEQFSIDSWPRQCARFVEEHIYDVICDQNEEHFWFLMRWLAHALHRPWENTTTALALIGPMGSGKDWFADCIADLFNPYTLLLDKPDQLTGKFNSHLQRALWVVAAEAFFAGRAQADQLKALISQERILVEPKGLDSFMSPKCFRLCMTSNRLGSLHIEQGDRRYFVLEVDGNRHGAARNKNAEYHGALRDDWKYGGGREAFFAWMRSSAWKAELLDHKSSLHLRPDTAAVFAQRLLSLDKVQRAVHNMLETGELPFACAMRKEGKFVPTMRFLQEHRLDDRSLTELGKLLGVLAADSSKRPMIDGSKPSGFFLPDLATCRQRWEQHLGQPVAWSTDAEWAGEGYDYGEHGR